MQQWTDVAQGLSPVCSSIDRRVKLFTRDVPHRQPVTFKQVICHSGEAISNAYQEWGISQGNPHPHLCRCESAHHESRIGSGSYVYLVYPYSLTTLESDVVARQRSDQPYSEATLWKYARDTIDALAHLQALGVAYRGVRLSSLLLDANGEVHVCRFEAESTIDARSQTMTDGFLSPEVRRSLESGSVNLTELRYNQYKSDVYSLGVCLFGLSLLDPSPLPVSVSDLESSIEAKLASMAHVYSDSWRTLLSQMVCTSESDRPDFEALRKNRLFPSAVIPPGHPDTLPYADDEQFAKRQLPEAQDPLTVTVQCGHRELRVDPTKVDEAPCMISLKAARFPVNETCYSIDLICAIDVSGSMEGDKLHLVRKTLTAMVGKMQEPDRMALVTFSNEAHRVTPLLVCNDSGKCRLKEEVGKLETEDLTDLGAGFRLAVEVARQRRECSNPVAIFLFTDGRNSDDRALLHECKAALEGADVANLQVHCFGFGETHDSELLENIAKLSKGSYHFIQHSSQIQEAFMFVFSHLQVVVASDITVTLEVNKNGPVQFTIPEIFSIDGKQLFSIDKITANTQKDLLFLLKTPYMSLHKPVSFNAVQVTVTFCDLTNTASTLSSQMAVSFVPPCDTYSPVVEEVLENYYRVLGARALATIQTLEDKGLHSDAILLVLKSIQQLELSKYAAKPMVEYVLSDLKQVKRKLEESAKLPKEELRALNMMTYSHFSQNPSLLSRFYASEHQSELLRVVEQS